MGNNNQVTERDGRLPVIQEVRELGLFQLKARIKTNYQIRR